jgi:RNA polymerase sigma factor (sigma-70 family)
VTELRPRARVRATSLDRSFARTKAMDTCLNVNTLGVALVSRTRSVAESCRLEREKRGGWCCMDVLGARDQRGADTSSGSLTSLVERVRGGDVTAWNAIIDRFAGLVWSVARRHRLSASDAADVSQTTWLRLVEHIDRIKDPERVGGWLATTARHEALRVLRVSGRELPSEHENFIDLLPDDEAAEVDADFLAEERDHELWELVSMLPARCQLLLSVLHAESQLSYVEIGQALDMPTGSIGPTRGRCLEHLRRLAQSRGITRIAGVS